MLPYYKTEFFGLYYYQELASAVEVSHLIAHVGSSVDDTWSHAGAVRELPGLVVDLK